jgi:putative aldouronate transport system permease protein
MLLPFIVLVPLFAYLPPFGWRYAFFNYRPCVPLKRSDFVGFDWFLSITSSPARQAEVVRVASTKFFKFLTNLLDVFSERIRMVLCF